MYASWRRHRDPVPLLVHESRARVELAPCAQLGDRVLVIEVIARLVAVPTLVLERPTTATSTKQSQRSPRGAARTPRRRRGPGMPDLALESQASVDLLCECPFGPRNGTGSSACSSTRTATASSRRRSSRMGRPGLLDCAPRAARQACTRSIFRWVATPGWSRNRTQPAAVGWSCAFYL